MLTSLVDIFRKLGHCSMISHYCFSIERLSKDNGPAFKEPNEPHSGACCISINSIKICRVRYQIKLKPREAAHKIRVTNQHHKSILNIRSIS